MPQTSPPDGWHLDKKVPISIIAVLVMQAVAGLWFISEIRSDVNVLKAAQLMQHERDNRQDQTTADAVALVRGDIQELGRKLDRLIERGAKP